MPCHAHSWRLESNVTPGEQFSGILLATHVPRLWPYCLSVTRRARNLSSRTLSRSKRKEIRLFSRAPPEKLNFTNPGNELGGGKISKKTKMDEKTATTGEWRSFFFFLSFSIISSAYLFCICSCMKIYFVRCKVFTSGFYFIINGCW